MVNNADNSSLYWDAIARYQKLSDSFIYKYEDRISFYELLESEFIEEYSEEMQNYILLKIMTGVLDNFLEYENNINVLKPYMRQQYEKFRILL